MAEMVASLSTRIDRASGRLAWLPPLILRALLGVTFIVAGWGKLHDLEKTAQFFDSLGIPSASAMAPFVAVVELIGGIMILAGLGTRIAALLLAIVMVVAIATAIWPKQSFIDVLGSVEAAYLASFIYLMLRGAGAFSLDHLAARFIPERTGGTRAHPPEHAAHARS